MSTRSGLTANFAKFRARFERAGVAARQMGTVMRQAAQLAGEQARSEWVGLAKANLDSTASEYISSIGPVEVKGRSNTTEFKIRFNPPTDLIRGVEFGMRPFDMRKGFIKSGSVSSVIHFSHAFNASGASKSLAKKYAAHGVEHGATFAKYDIQRVLQQSARSSGKLGIAGPLFAVRSVTREAKLTRTTKREMQFAHPSNVVVKSDAAGRPMFFSKTMRVKSWSAQLDRPAERSLFTRGRVTRNAGGGGQIDTFRAISNKTGQGWIHPGIKARNFMRTVRRNLRNILRESMTLVREAWVQALASGGQLDVTQLAAQLSSRRGGPVVPIQIIDANAKEKLKQARRAAGLAARFGTHPVHSAFANDPPALAREKRLQNRIRFREYKADRERRRVELSKQQPASLGLSRRSHEGNGTRLTLARYKQTLGKRRGEPVVAARMANYLLGKQRMLVNKARAEPTGSKAQLRMLSSAKRMSPALADAERDLQKAIRRSTSAQYGRGRLMQTTAYMERRAEAARVRRGKIISAKKAAAAAKAAAGRQVMRRVAGAPRQQLGATERSVLQKMEAKATAARFGQRITAAPASMSRMGGSVRKIGGGSTDDEK